MKNKIKMMVELEYDSETMHSGNNDPEAKKWFENILQNDMLMLHSNEIGDEIGNVKVLEILTPMGGNKSKEST